MRVALLILVLIIATLVIVLLLITFFGSPEDLTIVSWVVGLILALQILIITILFQIKGDIGGLKEFKRQTIESNKQTINKLKEVGDRTNDLEKRLLKKKR